MKIYLFLANKLLNFLLPEEIMGSYSYGEEGADSKLVNIEAENGFWYLYSTNDSKIIENNVEVERLELTSERFYVLKRNKINYLIYVSNIENLFTEIYNYNQNFTMTIGKNEKNNLVFVYPMLGDVIARLSLQNGKIIIEKNDNFVYINNLPMTQKTAEIKYGDQINLYYAKLIILPGSITVIGDKKINTLNMETANIKKAAINQNDPQQVEIKDQDLYQKNDYYFKSPRIRRFIETKKIKFSRPPSSEQREEMPAILTLGPMFAMAVMSAVNFSQVIIKVISGQSKISSEWTRLLTSIAMLSSSILWPFLTKWYSKKIAKRRKKKIQEKYSNYLNEQRKDLDEEVKYQSDVLRENLLSTSECLNIISKKGYNFWDRRSDQSDFLQVRLGVGTEKLDVDIDYSVESFTIDESDLKQQADKLVGDYKSIFNVPIRYSLYENKITAILGNSYKSHTFVNNLLLQLLTFYTYEDIKIAVFTNDDNKHYWEYLKYTNHNLSNRKDKRLFSTNVDSAKDVAEYLKFYANQRKSMKRGNGAKPLTPHFLLLIDNYSAIKSLDFIKLITENEDDIGFSIILIEDRLSDLPSRCNNFISMGTGAKCEVMMNSSDSQEQIEFAEEIVYGIDYMQVARMLSNTPIEFETEDGVLPDSISFLEMEKVGKVEQLNILNRWNTNDSTVSLKSEIGVDASGNLLYLDLHEKNHGPHGLIAGTTGSGKSEFIITYILSMCINYSPDIISFVLIDYKGGGLALAFENRSTGVVLPHLAGTITNLDKAEMDRTLVSIDSEVKRRQKLFNEARETLGESTMDIYKYQRFYKEGRLTEPIPHLFIICDEFAELKSQQPEFMDNLISVARIGRSLGVHLILATQKPSGVVNDQIWSNSKFKVCLKVQDESDSKEMLKKPDAAYLKQAGRFYLQVGYDEYYVLGQSAWSGAKYYPSDEIVKEVDKSVNFINDCGTFIKSIKAAGKKKGEAKGDQLGAVMNSIIEVSQKIGKKAMRLWLDNIEPVILIDDIQNKYQLEVTPYNVEGIIGEYDAPEMQSQDIVKYNYLKDGNTIVYGNDSIENEMFLEAMIYSTCKNHTADEVNFYAIDYGAEIFRKFEKLPQLGGVAYASDSEKYNNLIKFITDEIKRRKKLFSDFGGDYSNYIKKEKLPLIVVIFNNFDAINDNNPDLYEIFPEISRDSERYGIVFVITCSTTSSVRNKVVNNFPNAYAFKLKDKTDYYVALGAKASNMPREVLGRGFVKHTILHEFQTAGIAKDQDGIMNAINELIESQTKLNSNSAKKIPILPDHIRYDIVKEKITTLKSVPIGMSKESLNIQTVDFITEIGSIISANKLDYTLDFVKSLLAVFMSINSVELYIIDPLKSLGIDNFKNYFTEDLDGVISKLNTYLEKLKESKATNQGIIVIYGVDKFLSKLEDKKILDSLSNNLKSYENFGLVIIDDSGKIKGLVYDNWFKTIFNASNGIWIGKGMYEQSLFRVTTLTKDMKQDIKNNMGYVVSESSAELCRVLDFFTTEEEQ